MKTGVYIFYIILFSLTFCGGDGLKQEFVYTTLFIIPIAVFSLWVKTKIIRILGKVLFSIFLLFYISNGVTVLLFWLFPKKPVPNPVMGLDWQDEVGLGLGLAFVIWFLVLVRKEKPNVFYVLLGVISLSALWLGFELADRMPYG